MPLVIKFPSSQEEKGEMAVIELQGDLECRTNSTLNSQFIGDLYFRKQTDGSTLPVLIIGHHILSGKVQNLEKPLALMERKRINAGNVEFNIQALVTKKIFFKTRPKPIVSS